MIFFKRYEERLQTLRDELDYKRAVEELEAEKEGMPCIGLKYENDPRTAKERRDDINKIKERIRNGF